MPGYDPAFFARLAALEAHNYWFQHRCRVIVWALRRYAPGCRSFLEIGCGTGFVLQAIRESFPAALLVGGDLFPEALAFAEERVPSAKLLQLDACNLPYNGEFDAAGAFDVLEHLSHDEDALAGLSRSLRPGGILVLTVPQHPWLWSRADDAAQHQRRYTRDQLIERVKDAGLRVCYAGSFVSTVLPAMALSRLWPRARGDVLAELSVSPALNGMLSFMLALERPVIRAGIRLPSGGSLVLVARRPPAHRRNSLVAAAP